MLIVCAERARVEAELVGGAAVLPAGSGIADALEAILGELAHALLAAHADDLVPPIQRVPDHVPAELPGPADDADLHGGCDLVARVSGRCVHGCPPGLRAIIPGRTHGDIGTSSRLRCGDPAQTRTSQLAGLAGT